MLEARYVDLTCCVATLLAARRHEVQVVDGEAMVLVAVVVVLLLFANGNV